MSKNSLKYIVLFFLLQLLVEVKSQAPFKPSNERFSHSATLIENKFYILGGFSLDGTTGKEFFYLDASVKFNTQNIPWQDLSSVNIIPSHFGAASARGGS